MTTTDDAVVRGAVIQFGLGLSNEVMARCERLRACLDPETGVSRSNVIEMALTGGGLNKLERACEDRIQRFDALAVRSGQGWITYAHEYADRWNRKTYPPTVAELEAMEQTKALNALAG